jgi:hypothetical protein
MLFKEIIPVYSKKSIKHVNPKYRVTDWKAAGTCSYHSVQKVK